MQCIPGTDCDVVSARQPAPPKHTTGEHTVYPKSPTTGQWGVQVLDKGCGCHVYTDSEATNHYRYVAAGDCMIPSFMFGRSVTNKPTFI